MPHRTLQWLILFIVTSVVLFGTSLAIIRTNNEAVVSHGLFEGVEKHQLLDRKADYEVILVDEYYVYHWPKLAWEFFISSVVGMFISGILLLRYGDENEG